MITARIPASDVTSGMDVLFGRFGVPLEGESPDSPYAVAREVVWVVASGSIVLFTFHDGDTLDVHASTLLWTMQEPTE